MAGPAVFRIYNGSFILSFTVVPISFTPLQAKYSVYINYKLLLIFFGPQHVFQNTYQK